MTGGKYDAARPALSNEMRCCRCRQQSVATDDHMPDTIACGDLQNSLNRLSVEEPSISADDECVGCSERGDVEQRLHEILEVILLPENGSAFPESRCPGFLVGKRRCLN